MHEKNEHLTRARALRADILAAPDVWLPRRENILSWLDSLLARSGESEADDTTAADLAALDQFLRKKAVPVAA